MPSDVGSQTVALGWGPASDQIGGKTRELNLQYTIDINFYMYSHYSIISIAICLQLRTVLSFLWLDCDRLP